MYLMSFWSNQIILTDTVILVYNHTQLAHFYFLSFASICVIIELH